MDMRFTWIKEDASDAKPKIVGDGLLRMKGERPMARGRFPFTPSRLPLVCLGP